MRPNGLHKMLIKNTRQTCMLSLWSVRNEAVSFNFQTTTKRLGDHRPSFTCIQISSRLLIHRSTSTTSYN